jgi:hypothetical protein
MSAELIGGLIGFLLTLMVLSYLIGDNPFFRVAVYLFVGVSAGYVAAVAWWQILWPRLVVPLLTGGFVDRIGALFALFLGILLLLKISPRTSRAGDPVVAYLVGIAAAVAIGGAVLGTLIPQTQASINAFDLSNAGANWAERLFFGALMLIGTATTLIYFHFGARSTPTGPQRNRAITILSWIGQVFIAITLGVLFAGVFTASLTALIERISSLADFIARVKALF